ncbi:helix-turn-helix domain-containing protein [Leptospira sp. 'Mane']|uniref:helix-turn-helix domain-containing protein n=1 Tax=Leptospira sp. 'Mane' TaxID=3387407 RepID=UPI00398BAADE
MRTGIWIPVWIENLKLTNSQKKLLAEVVSLHQKGRCFASNKYFSEVLNLKPDTISGMIAGLKKQGLIRQTGFDGRKRFLEPVFASDENPRHDQKETTRDIPAILNSSASDSDFGRGSCTLIIESKKEMIIEPNSFHERIKGFSKDTRTKLLRIFDSREVLHSETFDSRILRIWERLGMDRKKCLN